jgi:hypothetical protein
MRLTNLFVAPLAISSVSAIAITTAHAENATSIAALAAKMHQTYFTKDEIHSSAVVSAAALAIVSANHPDFTVAGLESHFHKVWPRDVASADTIAATAVTDPDDWRYFHYEGLRTGNDHWWRGGGSKVYEIKAAHDQVVTPALPKGIKIPKPLLPTHNTHVLALYVLAMDQYEAEEKKGMSEKMDNLAEKKRDMMKFNQMNQCVHDKNFCTDLKFRDALWLSGYYKKYKQEYTALFEKLKEDMLVEGLVELGREVSAFMAETGEKVEIS